MDLIKSDEVFEAIDRLMSEWPDSWRTCPSKRLALDTLHDCAQAISAFEDAARMRAADTELSRKAANMAEAICMPAIRKAGL